MRNGEKQPGYILVFSLMFIALVVMLSTRISNVGRVHAGYSKIMLDREHAKILAFSGLQIAMTQLSIPLRQAQDDRGGKKEAEKSDTKKTGAKKGAGTQALWTEKEAKEFIKNVFPVLYEWQEFRLDEKRFGTDGVVKICIGSEEGKIDINQRFNQF